VEDIGAFAEDIFNRENLEEETKVNSIRWFKSLFEQGKSVKAALATEFDY
jgi:hypothetical protein